MAGEEDFMEEFKKNPDEAHWKQFVDMMKRDNASYYKTVFAGKNIGSADDLKDAYVIIYDKNYDRLYTVPIVVLRDGKYEGATIYLRDLEINRKEFN
jgi:hypothetical protein